MGREFLTENVPTHIQTDAEKFEEAFPFYLAIGMSYAEYWEGDPSLARYYRKAYRIKQDEINNNAWLQGLYVYDALSTALYNALSKKHARPRKYAQQPYNFNKEHKSEIEKIAEVEKEQEKAAAWMNNFVRINQSQSHRARAKN